MSAAVVFHVCRCPEVMLGIPYTTAVDIWSFGCCMLEMLTRKPPFRTKGQYICVCMYVCMYVCDGVVGRALDL